MVRIQNEFTDTQAIHNARTFVQMQPKDNCNERGLQNNDVAFSYCQFFTKNLRDL